MEMIGDQAFVNPRDTRLAYADIIGDESLSGKLIGAGPILERIDIFGAAVAENVACKGIATISVDRVDITNRIAHGDLVRLEGEVIYTGSSSMAVQITGYRHDIEAGKFIQTLSAIMTCVALDENLRPSPGLPKLLDPLDLEYVKKHEKIAAQRKELAAQWRAVQEQVDQLPHVSVDMIKTHNYGRSLEVPISDTLIEVQNSFLPKHLNRNNTIFGGEVLTWMDKVALYCARNFTKNQNMVTVSMNRIFFRLPITMDDIVTMHARVSSSRRHHLEVEVEVFIERIGAKKRRKSHTGYFTVVNLDRSYRTKQILTGLKVDENDQESMRTLLKAQHRWMFDNQERKLLTLKPLSLSTPNFSAKL
ncbi:atp-binding cassette superfamily [Plasmopara halstedii]|uniref:Atp-binding cassette superfamily n=1 Tax=Plasmopara halstedii TaxID=4781 RepID=A0A0N7L3B3_PLAHL|nr:atp-binding cassette superfamily [Plasmopara halstedii]CEG35395.1 atp-binding cassette superfamily [Plasmopara halstedii]|eukprot:XP_024571764.1 atp-binding cassette superfamily [Plasmopara halstedii]